MHSIENGGLDATNFMEEPIGRILAEQETSYEQVEIETSSLLKRIKEKVSAVAMDYEADLEDSDDETPLDQMEPSKLEKQAFVMPDNKMVIRIDKHTRYRSGEILLRPTARLDNQDATHFEMLGIHDKNKRDLVLNIIDSLDRVDVSLRNVKFLVFIFWFLGK